MAVSSHPDVHMEDVEEAEDKAQEPAQSWCAGGSGMAGSKLPQRILVDIQYDGGQDGNYKRETDTLRIL